MTSIKLPAGASTIAGDKFSSPPVPDSKNPEKVARDFEALLLKQMIDSMWNTVPKEGLLSGSNEENMYRDMLNQALATSISEGKGIGVKEVIMKDINRLTKTR